MLTALFFPPAGLTSQDGHTSSKHPPPRGDPDSRPWGAVCCEEGDEGRPSISAILCEEPG